MVAVVVPPTGVRAAAQVGLAARAAKVVEPNRPRALAKVRRLVRNAAGEAELPAHDLRVGGSPVSEVARAVVADGAPHAVVVDLDAAGEVGRAASQTKVALGSRRRGRRGRRRWIGWRRRGRRRRGRQKRRERRRRRRRRWRKLARHAGVLAVVAVVVPPTGVRAAAQVGLAARAAKVVEPNRPRALAKVRRLVRNAAGEAELPAHDLRVGGSPVSEVARAVVADGAPHAVVVDLDAAGEVGRAASQTEVALGSRRRGRWRRRGRRGRRGQRRRRRRWQDAGARAEALVVGVGDRAREGRRGGLVPALAVAGPEVRGVRGARQDRVCARHRERLGDRLKARLRRRALRQRDARAAAGGARGVAALAERPV